MYTDDLCIQIWFIKYLVIITVYMRGEFKSNWDWWHFSWMKPENQLTVHWWLLAAIVDVNGADVCSDAVKIL